MHTQEKLRAQKWSLTLLELLGRAGLDIDQPTRMVRHQQARYPILELLREGWVETYQAYQTKPVFDTSFQVVAFAGLEGSRACLFGVFKKTGRRPARAGLLPVGCPWALEWQRDAEFFYELERIPGFEDLEGRVVIDWPPPPIRWERRLVDRPVLEILPKGRRVAPFRDYLDFSLSYRQLRDLFENEAAHGEWRARLEAVAGIYLILAQDSGELYVGSASGAGGIWSRWRSYVDTGGHGGNALLKELLARDGRFPTGFRFSVLQIFPKTWTRDELLKREILFKTKLGSRAHGLNLN